MDAREELRRREGILPRNIDRHVGTWLQGDSVPAPILGLDAWAAARQIDAVLWTALPPKFSGVESRAPSVDEAVSYLADLAEPTRGLAEEYVRRTPGQIATAYRRRIEADLGWF